MHAFAYARADDLGAAARFLAATPGARVLAGGTDLLPELKRRLGPAAAPSVLLDVKRAGLAEPRLRAVERLADGGLSIGALVTLAELEAHPLLQGGPFAALAEACASAATPALRAQATIGGNLLQAPRCWYYRAGLPCAAAGAPGCPARDGDARFHALFPGEECIDVHPSDAAAALALLRARLEIRTAGGAAREVALRDFLGPPTQAHPRFHALEPGEVVAAVLLPARRAGFRSAYEKGMSRETWSFALAGVALGAVRGADGAWSDVELALGGVAAAPVLVPDLDLALAGASPHPASAYKVELLRGLAARARERLGIPDSAK